MAFNVLKMIVDNAKQAEANEEPVRTEDFYNAAIRQGVFLTAKTEMRKHTVEQKLAAMMFSEKELA